MRNLSSLFQTKKLPYKFGLALSGGGSKGFAHLGVLKALDEKNIRPEIIAGTSAGSFAGALYADGYHPEEILSLFEKKAFKQFAEFTIPQAGIFKANRLHEFLKKHLRAKNFEDLKIQLKVTATNIENGTSVVFDKGPIIPTILASCAFPIIFTPIEIDGIHYVDGGLFKNLPSSLIRKDCQTVVGVNVNPITKQDYKNSLLFIAERSFHYVSMANAIPDRKICDILIEPKKVSNFSMFTLEHTKEIYDIGYHAAIASFKKEKNIPIWGKLLETKK